MSQHGAMFVALALALLSLGAHGTRLTDTGFPFEGCKQRMASKGYAARLVTYRQWKTGSYMCWSIWATDEKQCNKNNGYPNNKTRCCDTIMTKFKVWPKSECIGAVKKVWVKSAYDREPINVPFSMQEMDAGSVQYYTPPHMRDEYPGSEWVWKVTNLRWSRAQADGSRICMQLQDPCPHMQDYARDGEKLEWLMYDSKVDDYECCFPGVSRAVSRAFGKSYGFKIPAPGDESGDNENWLVPDNEYSSVIVG